MKEFSLQDLLNLADASAQDGICDFWNQKAIHYLVVFTSSQEDFEIIGVGPTLPCASLEDAERHVIPGKKPEFYVKCPAAVVKRLQPKLAPTTSLHQPTPSLKGRTTVPFTHLEPKPAVPSPAPAASSPHPAATPEISSPPETPASKLEASSPSVPSASLVASFPSSSSPPPASSDLATPSAPSPVASPSDTRAAELDARERALAEREQVVAAREQLAQTILELANRKKAELAELEARLREREAAAENRLLDPSTLAPEKPAVA